MFLSLVKKNGKIKKYGGISSYRCDCLENVLLNGFMEHFYESLRYFSPFFSVHPTLSSDYEIRIKYKYNIVDSF